MRVVVASLKGGVGKTTTAVYLAAAAAKAQAIAQAHANTNAGPNPPAAVDSSNGRRRVIVVDADPQGSAAAWLEERPIDGVEITEAPSERLLARSLGDGAALDQALVIVDTPPASERLAAAALSRADVAIVPTRIGGVELPRVAATLDVVPESIPAGLVVSSARSWTRDFKDMVEAWTEAGLPVWGVVPERVGIAAGPEAELHQDGLEAATEIWRRVLEVTGRRTG